MSVAHFCREWDGLLIYPGDREMDACNCTDLFGQIVAPPVGPRTAYPAMPGTGPEGKTCKDCANYCRTLGASKAYLKCGLMRAVWTGGPGTDIRAGSPACSKFQEPTGT